MESDLIKAIIEIKRSEVKQLIDKRMSEFKSVGRKSINKIFNELCFCILTANSTAERCIYVQKNVGDGFSKLKEKDLIKTLKRGK